MKRYLRLLAVLGAGALIFALAGCPQPTGNDEPEEEEVVIDFARDFYLIDFDLNGDGTTETEEVLDGAGGKVASYDADGDGTADKFDTDGDGTADTYLRKVTGRFTSDIEFTKDAIWFLEAGVFIGDTNDDLNGDSSVPDGDGNGVLDSGYTKTTLTIEAGTEIRGLVSATTPGVLVIDRGGQINAVGTESDPIVFTSANDAGSRQPGDWGGLVINGFGIVQKGLAQGEGSTGTYGGDDEDDSSGTLQYVRVEFGGTLFSSDNELNGIAFQGVGAGTDVSYIQVHQNADDGVEFFGGNVQVQYVVLTGNQDDSLDHDDGWDGSAQYVYIQQYPGGDHGIEGDGDSQTTDDKFTTTGRVVDPVSAILANFTYVGNTGTDDGFRFRRDAAPSVYNSLITNVASGENSIDMQSTDDNDTPDPSDDTDESAGTVTFGGVVVTSAVENKPEVTWTDATDGNALVSTDYSTGVAVDTGSAYSFNRITADSSDGTAQTLPTTDPAGNTLDSDGSSFIGAIDPSGTDWTQGWITTAKN